VLLACVRTTFVACMALTLLRMRAASRWVAVYFAISRAASCTIEEVFSSQAGQVRDALAKSDIAAAEGSVDASSARDRSVSFAAILTGVRWGARVCDAIIRERAGDRSEDAKPFTYVPVATPPKPYAHRPDPTVLEDFGKVQQNYAAHWGRVEGFGIADIQSSLPRLPRPPPPVTALQYPSDFERVKCVGRRKETIKCKGKPTLMGRTAEQLETGIFWAYDGVFRVGTPIKLYNDVLDAIVQARERRGAALAPVRRARLYALANVVLADAAIAAWREKYAYNFWRPVVGIRYDRELAAEEGWRPYGVPQTNMGTKFVNATTTPAFPAYPSGHATMGTAALVAIRDELGLKNSFRFKFTSAEFDGNAKNPDGSKRPPVTRTLTILDAIKQNQDSRVFLGVHWQFDSVKGGVLGEKVGRLVHKAFPARAVANRPPAA
jgi:membrane-associated phospholipid phosphatase